MAEKLWTGATSTAWATAGNWSPSGAPDTTGDKAYFDSTSSTNGVAGADISATTLDAMAVRSTFTKTIGDATTPLKINVTELRLHEASGSSTPGQGSGRINLDLATTSSTVYVYGSSTQSTDTGLEPIRIKGGGSSTKVYVVGSGRVGLATNALGDTMTLADISVTGDSAVLNVGAGVTWTNVYQDAGTINLFSGGTTINQIRGTLNLYGTGAVTTLKVGGTCKLNMRASSGATVTTLEILANGTVDLSDLPSAITITTVKIHPGGRLIVNAANPSHVTITNAIELQNCGTISAAA